MLEILPFLIGMAVLLALSAFFSGSETALFSLTATDMHRLRTGGARLGQLIGRLLVDAESLLISLLICNMVVNVVYFTFSSVAVVRLKRGGAPGLGTLLAIGALVAIVLAGEVAPKVLACWRPTAYARLVAVPMFLVHNALGPVRRLLRSLLVRPLTRLAHPPGHTNPQVSVEELRALLEVSEHHGILQADETMMLQEIVGLAEMKVRQITVPRVQIVAFDLDQPREQLHELLRSSHLAKVPVYRGDLDHIVGLAYAKQVFLWPGRPLSELLAPVRYVAELATVEQLLLEFRRSRAQIAIVVDEYGGTAGLITLQDVLEEIVGDLDDALTPACRPLVEQVGPAQYSISGQLPIRDWAETFGHDLEAAHLETVAGLVLHRMDMGRLPRVGDTVEAGNVTFTIEQMRGRRIERLLLTVRPAGEEAS